MGPRPCGRGRADRRRHCPPRDGASMGPRPCGRGRPSQGAGSSGRIRASMGPRPCGRGRASGRANADKQLALQWGHGLAAVDGAYPFHRDLPSILALMGPRPCGRGRWKIAGQNHHGMAMASMGPRPCGRGRPMEIVFALCVVELQWGHGLAAVDGSMDDYVMSYYDKRFNGATALRPWTEAQILARAGR